MRTIDELGISPAPWKVEDKGVFVIDSVNDANGKVITGVIDTPNALLIAAAPELYEALFDCCEEVNGHDAPRCYGCRRGSDGHCMAKNVCSIYKALDKASGEEVK